MDFQAYYFIFLPLLSNKLWDIFYIIINGLFNLILWESRTFTNGGIDTQECIDKILSKIEERCFICSGGRIKYHNYLVPLGYILCKDGSFVKITENFSDVSFSSSRKIISIRLYGWWSINNLISKEFIQNIKTGKYKLYYYNTEGYDKDCHKKMIDFPDVFYHQNSQIGAKKIYHSILNTHNKSGVYLLTGLSGLGKTNTGMYLAKLLNYNATVCNDFSIINKNITSFSIRMNYICYEVEPSDYNYLICIIDEVDEIITDIYEKKEFINAENVASKRSWNYFLEQVHLLQNVILIMTTNKNIEYFNNLDISFMREYRVTKIYNYTETDVDEVII